MKHGPSVVSLTHRLASTPSDFLSEAAIGPQGLVVVKAVVADLLRGVSGQEPDHSLIDKFSPDGGEALRNWQQLLLVACWLMKDPGFTGHPSLTRLVSEWFLTGLRELADLVKAERFVQSEEHREELARLCLKALGLLPEGETPTQAQDRLETVSTLERRRVQVEGRRVREEARKRREILEKQQQEQARIAREEMEKRAAASGAAKVSRD